MWVREVARGRIFVVLRLLCKWVLGLSVVGGVSIILNLLLTILIVNYNVCRDCKFSCGRLDDVRHNVDFGRIYAVLKRPTFESLGGRKRT